MEGRINDSGLFLSLDPLLNRIRGSNRRLDFNKCDCIPSLSDQVDFAPSHPELSFKDNIAGLNQLRFRRFFSGGARFPELIRSSVDPVAYFLQFHLSEAREFLFHLLTV
jgi:hypothetical protein